MFFEAALYINFIFVLKIKNPNKTLILYLYSITYGLFKIIYSNVITR